jgi:hypothetical protein
LERLFRPKSLKAMVCLLLLLPFAGALAAEAVWQPFETLGDGDRYLAESALAPMFGDDADLWPDWLEPRALLLPVGHGDTWLIVREPYRARCGQYLFTVFGAVTRERTRVKLGDGFCAGELSIVPSGAGRAPDLQFAEGSRQDGNDGEWRRVDQRVRWSGRDWEAVSKGEKHSALEWLTGR